MSQPYPMGARVSDPMGRDIVEEFDLLLLALDNYTINRKGWQRIKVLLTLATLEAGDIELGTSGYRKAVEKWRRSLHFDGWD
jgi:hypothetical protein